MKVSVIKTQSEKRNHLTGRKKKIFFCVTFLGFDLFFMEYKRNMLKEDTADLEFLFFVEKFALSILFKKTDNELDVRFFSLRKFSCRRDGCISIRNKIGNKY